MTGGVTLPAKLLTALREEAAHRRVGLDALAAEVLDAWLAESRCQGRHTRECPGCGQPASPIVIHEGKPRCLACVGQANARKRWSR
jgi:hypothetical protein